MDFQIDFTTYIPAVCCLPARPQVNSLQTVVCKLVDGKTVFCQLVDGRAAEKSQERHSKPKTMNYPREFFDLNFAFVYRVSEILGQPWPDLLLAYTHTFRRFRLGAALDPHHPVWCQFLEGVRRSDDPAGYAHQFYLYREQEAGPLQRQNAFGCFSYTLEGNDAEKVLRIHFANLDPSGVSPLGRESQGQRLSELTRMFTQARQAVQPSCRVQGASWLYHLNGYRRLFPAEFTASLTTRPPDFPMLALWGQFLDHRWQVRPELAGSFLERLQQARTMTELEQAFPYSILMASAGIEIFYTFYGIGPVN